MTHAAEPAARLAPQQPAALVLVPRRGLAIATMDGTDTVETDDLAGAVAALSAPGDPRWVWWSAASTAAALVAAGVRPRACWDLAAVHRLLHGGRRDDPGTVWALAHDLPAEGLPRTGQLTLLDGGGDGGDGDPGEPVRPDGYLRPDWVAAPPADLARAARWAALALDVQRRQAAALAAVADPRATPRPPALPLQTAYAESAAALLAVELAHDGLPVDVPAAEALLGGLVGPRPSGPADEAAGRARRDAAVLATLPDGTSCDLRNPAAVRAVLQRLGFDVPDTRSWRLEPFRGAHPVIEALLGWRRAERFATTYGYGWLDAHVGPDGRLRGGWTASDGGAGRMTAQAGLHSLPAELRPAVAAEPGHVFVRADLGQVEPRVLAAVSGDPALAAATRADDLYAPVAAALGCDRPTAKVAVLAAMYGQTSGTAGAALRRMERAYPRALRFLAEADAAGRAGDAVRTWGGRPVPMYHVDPDATGAVNGRGRYARNAVVQGAAAELFKAWAAAVRVGLAASDGRIVLCLHDELLVHVAERYADATAALVTRCLASRLRVRPPPHHRHVGHEAHTATRRPPRGRSRGP